MRSPDRPWPVVPRVFDDEGLGSWFGRVAARYRMNVGELAASIGLEADRARLTRCWLSLGWVGDSDLHVISALSRKAPAELRVMRDRDTVASDLECLRFCYRCLFVNDLDVTSPYWKCEWLAGELPSCCRRHGMTFDMVSSGLLDANANMERLLRAIGQQVRHRADTWCHVR